MPRMLTSRRGVAVLGLTATAIVAVPSIASATVTGGPGDVYAGATNNFKALPGVDTGAITVGTFYDNDGSYSGDFLNGPVIHWGDGTSSPATLVDNWASGGVDIVGSHIYANPGQFSVSAEVNDDDEGAGSSVISDGIATVGKATSGSQVVTQVINGGQLGFTSVPGVVTTNPVQLTGLNQVSGPLSLPLDVSDATGSGNGWNVSLTTTPFTNTQGKVITGDLLEAAEGTPACDTGATCTGAADASGLVSLTKAVQPGAATIVQQADQATGLGNQSMTPTFNLAIPANTYAGTYTSSWTVSIASAPSAL